MKAISLEIYTAVREGHELVAAGQSVSGPALRGAGPNARQESLDK
jgi:hypothetical protein